MQKLKAYILPVSLAIFSMNVHSQSYLNLKAGIGIPDLAGGSIGLQSVPFQVMLGAGFLPIPDDKLITVHGDLYFHLFGYSSRSEIKPWYGRIGLNYFREETSKWIDKYTYLDIRAGRTFFFSDHLSIEVDIGTAVELSYDREYIIPYNPWLIFDFIVIPAIGTRIVYRLPI